MADDPWAVAEKQPIDEWSAVDKQPVAKPLSGAIANLGAGINESLAGLLGLPGDLAAGAQNLVTRGINAVAGTHLPTIEKPIVGSANIKKALGLIGANPDDVVVSDRGDWLARSLGQGFGSMVLPGVGSEAALASDAAETLSPVVTTILKTLRGNSETSALGNVAKNAVIGATSGAGQSAGEAIAPKGYEGVGGFLGSLLGGISPEAGKSAFEWAFRHPATKQVAADAILRSASDADQFKRDLHTPSENLAGVEGTPGEITNDAGILQAQNWARNQNPELFSQRAANNNAGRVRALEGIAPAAGLSPGELVTQHLSELDAAQKALEDAAGLHAEEARRQIGGGRDAEDIGASARGQIAGRYDPAMRMANAGITSAEGRVSTALDRMGGATVPEGDFDTPGQAHGANLRQFVQGGRQARAAEENRLWTIARQNGDLVFDHTPAIEAVADARGRINPEGGDQLTPAEDRLYSIISGWRGPQDFETIKAMRTNIGDATNAAYRAGDSQAGSRLRSVRAGLDRSIESAIDQRVSQENAAISAGQLDPSRSTAAGLQRLADNLAAERDQWKANRANGQRPPAAVADSGDRPGASVESGTAAVPGLPGAEVQAGEGRPGDPGVQGIPGASPDIGLGSTSERYADARAYTRETHGIFDDTPAGNVIARGPYGAPEKLPDSLVVRQFLNGKATEAEAVRNFETATGGRPEAINALHEAAMADLRAKALDENGRLIPGRLRTWLTNHDGILSVYPELRQRIGNVQQAQQQLSAVQALRDQLAERYATAMGDSNATVMKRYFQPGPKGADAMDAYIRETGNTPEAQRAMEDHIANSLFDRFARTGWTDGGYKGFLSQYQAALSRRPDILAKFDTAAKAQEAFAQATQKRIDVTKAFESGAARHWLNTDPNTAVSNALSVRSGNNPVQNMADLMALTKGDPAAVAGVKRAVRDWLMDKGMTGKEAGQSDTNWIRTQKMQDLINDNRAALAKVFNPEEMKTLDLLASSLKESDRSISGSKPPIGPGTARDIAADNRYGGRAQSLLKMLGQGALKVGTMTAGAHVGGVPGLIAGAFGSDIAKGIMSKSIADRQQAVRDLMVNALSDPNAMRLLLAHASPSNAETAVQRLARRMSQVTAATSARYMPAD